MRQKLSPPLLFRVLVMLVLILLISAAGRLRCLGCQWL